MTDFEPQPIVTAAAALQRAPSLQDFVLTGEDGPDYSLIEDAITEFEGIFTEYRGFAPITRETTDTITERPLRDTVMLRWPYVQTISTFTADDDDVDVSAAVYDLRLGFINGVSWPGSVVIDATITYQHGDAVARPIVQRGCIEYVRRMLVAEGAGTSRDTRSQSFDGGGTTAFVLPGPKNPTGFLEVDRILNTLPDMRRIGIA